MFYACLVTSAFVALTFRLVDHRPPRDEVPAARGLRRLKAASKRIGAGGCALKLSGGS